MMTRSRYATDFTTRITTKLAAIIQLRKEQLGFTAQAVFQPIGVAIIKGN
jgi:hypothetical protein